MMMMMLQRKCSLLRMLTLRQLPQLLLVVLVGSVLIVVATTTNAQQQQLPPPVIVNLSLVKTPSTIVVEGPIPSIVNLTVVGTQLSIIANVVPSANISRVVFHFDGRIVKTERNVPYAIAADSNSGATTIIYYPYINMTTLGPHVVMADVFHTNGTKVASTTAMFTAVGADSSSSSNSTKAPMMTMLTVPPTNRPATTTVPYSKAPVVWNTPTPPLPTGVQLLGELRKWHKLTLAFDGPFTSETNIIDNPFLKYRFHVVYTHHGSMTNQPHYVVPGYFAADGHAAETSATSGNQWHCHFTPNDIGLWLWRAHFVTGSNISGSFVIQPTNKSGRDHRGKGRLQYVGQHHLKFAETGEWFLKAGPDSPENFLAYDDFDNTPNFGNYRKSWLPHEQHYNTSTDPTWQTGKGRGIIGAINYLASQGMNSFSFLTMNINGDDRNVYPYVSPTDLTRMDVSKLAQWEIVFEHADRMGFFLHFKTAESENDQLFNDGNLGIERKLYYRELIARFGHHLALNWNLGEEISNTAAQIRTFSDYFKATDPYQHVVVIHTLQGKIEFENVYKSLIGYPTLDAISLQLNPNNVFIKTLQWVRDSAISGRKWIVTNDEQNSAIDGVVPDTVDPNHDTIRQRSLWGNIMAGGAGVEYYFGYGHPNNDLTCQDYASRENMWKQSRYALEFFSKNQIPFWEMSYDRSNRVNNATDFILSDPANTILVLYRRTLNKPSTINMVHLTGMYSVRWYNPRDGGTEQIGSVSTVPGGGSGGSLPTKSLGNPPNSLDKKDWVILLRRLSSQ